MPSTLRRLFATILVFYEATDIRGLWDKHKDYLREDIRRDNSNTSTVEQMVLRDIQDMLHSMGKDIRDYDLPPICDVGISSIDMMKEVREEQNVFVDQDHLDIYDSLNKEQREGFDEIIQHVFAKKSRAFFCRWSGTHRQDVPIQGTTCYCSVQRINSYCNSHIWYSSINIAR